MIKFIFIIIIIIPLSFYVNFWVNQFIWFLIRFIFIMNFNFNYLFIHISYLFGMDLMSYLLILLRFWICSLMIIARERVYININWSKLFLILVLFLIIFLFLAFSSMNLFVFYLFFEIRLIPVLLLIIGWGYQPERLQAGIYLLFYTLLASLPIIICIFYVYRLNLSLDFFFLNFKINNYVLYFFINMVFFIKIPIFLVHLWLPKAHVEAPISGSIILAGIILKLGGYGFIRVAEIFRLINVKLNFFFISLRLIGCLIISLVCIRQRDMKCLIAYSSVVHIGLAFAGMITLNYWGITGALVIMIGHGLCSSGLFCLANICYERIYRRSLYLNKGLINIFPRLRLWWFLLVSSNMAFPPSLNLLREIILINRILAFCKLNMFILILVSFFRAVYSLYLYSFRQHGKIYLGVYRLFVINFREYLVLLLHWLPLNLIIIKRDLFSLWLYLSSLIKKFWFVVSKM